MQDGSAGSGTSGDWSPLATWLYINCYKCRCFFFTLALDKLLHSIWSLVTNRESEIWQNKWLPPVWAGEPFLSSVKLTRKFYLPLFWKINSSFYKLWLDKKTPRCRVKAPRHLEMSKQHFIEPFVKLQFMPFNEVWLSTTHAFVFRVSNKILITDEVWKL